MRSALYPIFLLQTHLPAIFTRRKPLQFHPNNSLLKSHKLFFSHLLEHDSPALLTHLLRDLSNTSSTRIPTSTSSASTKSDKLTCRSPITSGRWSSRRFLEGHPIQTRSSHSLGIEGRWAVTRQKDGFLLRGVDTLGLEMMAYAFTRR